MNIAIKYGSDAISFTRKKLIQYQILKEESNSSSKDGYLLKEFSEEMLKNLILKLEIPSSQQVTFNDLEIIYDLRDHITGNITLFPIILESIAIQYKRQEIRYAELSLNNILDPTWLKVVHEFLPKIEETVGVKLRFLAAIYNYSPKEKINKDIKILKYLYKSPYIVGVDFAGHETMSIDNIYPYIEDLAKWASETDKDFIIRVHAGETKQHEPNVKKVLLIAKQYKTKIRIGHAIYNIDEETLRYAQDLGQEELLTIELNPDSNIALNNICSESFLPILKFLEMNIPFVLGTDGGGIYATTPYQLLRNLISSITGKALIERILIIIHKTEKKYLEDQEKIFSRKISSLSSFDFQQPEYYALTESATQNSDSVLSFEAGSTKNLMDNVIPKDSVPILIVSNYLHEKESTSPINRENLEAVILTLADNLNLKKICFILTGIGSISDFIRTQFILHNTSYNRDNVTFFTAIDKSLVSNLDLDDKKNSAR
jgi:adenosine deaminase